ncbi:hypothetical protein OHT20_21655 [Streptomyces caniferus]|nr:hypothetical protein [Streptomyces caniferus]
MTAAPLVLLEERLLLALGPLRGRPCTTSRTCGTGRPAARGAGRGDRPGPRLLPGREYRAVRRETKRWAREIWTVRAVERAVRQDKEAGANAASG